MENNKGNIVMFPKWKTNLEKEGLQALKEKRYQDAVQSLQPLLDYDAANHDVYTGLLMSWIELGEFDEAEDLCKKQMKIEIDHYYHYLHIYITILFQTNRYQDIVDLLDEVFEAEDVPHQSRTQLWQMYEVSRKLLEDYQREQGEKLINDFLAALEKNNIQKQWSMVNQFKKQPALPHVETFRPILKDNSVHPIIKSAVIEWFRDSHIEDQMQVQKFGQIMEVVPGKLNQLQSDYIIKQIQMRLGGIEQNNPSMYVILDRLLYRYCYVRFPLFPNENEVAIIVEALKQIGHQYLQLPYHEKTDIEDVQKYIEEIELCEQHYALIIGE
ncbi:tetratricopeptide repeat protein [Halobacillus sp. B29]|uniref:tetratricopeptide repeat protein n=1 Tax=Halobacillus sp. B29 TaxID=3457432 RepID=UPI003FCCA271